MSKEIEIMAEERERLIQDDYADCYIEVLEVIKALQRLEAIDNANHSEALECLERVEEITKAYSIDLFSEFALDLDTIKQALLKAQEPKHYLKWEDLEFEEDGQETLVLLNGTKYRMYYYKGYDERITLFTEDESVIHMFEGGYPHDKQFFNDLKLEVEE